MIFTKRLSYLTISVLVVWGVPLAFAQFGPDIPLSQVDASFVGESTRDESGWIQPASISIEWKPVSSRRPGSFCY